MALNLNLNFTKGFVSEEEIANLAPLAKTAQQLLKSKSGAGNDFLGWVDLPVNYDKEEFARIKIAAEKIKKSCDILVVIGIGGSYLGARAAIEFVKSPLYNDLNTDTPDIYFAGNNISTTALTELLSICEGKVGYHHRARGRIQSIQISSLQQVRRGGCQGENFRYHR